MYKGEGCAPCSKYTFHGWNVGIMWPFIVLPIVLATGYRAVQTVWVIFMHYTLKTISQISDERFRSNCRYHDFFPFLCSRCSVNDVSDDGLIMEWLLNLVVDCLRSFRPCFARGGFSLAAFHAPACHFLSLLHAMWCAWEHNDPKSQTIPMWAIGSHGCELVLAWLCFGVVLANFVLWPALVAHAQVPSLVTSSWHRQHHAKSPVPAVIMKLLPFCQRLTKCAKRMQNDCGWMSFDWVLIFPNDRTNAKYMLNICFLCAAYICTGPRRQICEVYPLESQTPGAEFDSYEFQPFVVLILFFIISRSILGACG